MRPAGLGPGSPGRGCWRARRRSPGRPARCPGPRSARGRARGSTAIPRPGRGSGGRRGYGGGRIPGDRCTWGWPGSCTPTRPPVGGGRVGGRVGDQPQRDRRDAQVCHGPPGVDVGYRRAAVRVGHEAGLGAALAGLHRVGVRVALGEVPVGGAPMFHPAALCSAHPFQVFSLSWSRYHSATPCLTRRTSTVVALTPVMSAGSSVANSGMPCRDSSFSS